MPYKLKDPFRQKFDKAKFKVSNWNDYNKSLASRGRINIWFTQDLISGWYHEKNKKGTHGRQKYYSDLAIRTIKMLGIIFNQRLRQTQGFAESIISLMELDIDVPDYSTLSRRSSSMSLPSLHSSINSEETINIAIDSTGLKILGAGDWFENKHGKKQRQWKKLHIAIDLKSQKIISSKLTNQSEGDSSIADDLLSNIKNPINKMLADTAYDNFWVYQYLDKHKIQPIIPPRGPSILSKHCDSNPTQRDKLLMDRYRLGAYGWQKKSGYNRRSLVEVAIGRYKKIMGTGLYSRNDKNRTVDVILACHILNQMNELGMPKTIKVKKCA